jgi:PAS domain S-box-containing protein
MVKPMGEGSAARVEQAARAAEDEPSSRDAIMRTTRAGIVSSWNPPAVLLYGYLAEDIVGRAADVLWPPERRTQETEILQRVLAGGPAERFDAERFCKDGTMASVSLTVTPIVDEAGTVTGVITMSRKAETPPVPGDQAEGAGGGVESERRA